MSREWESRPSSSTETAPLPIKDQPKGTSEFTTIAESVFPSIDLNAEVLWATRQPLTVAEVHAAVVSRHPDVAGYLRPLDVESAMWHACECGALRPVYERGVPLGRRRYVRVLVGVAS